MGRLLVNGEYVKLLRGAFKSVAVLADEVRFANIITCVKEIHDMGAMADEEFLGFLSEMLKTEGFTWSSSNE